MQNEELTSLVDENENLYFFDSTEELNSFIKNKPIYSSKNHLNSKVIPSGSLLIYEHINYAGSSASFSFGDTGIGLNDLGLYGFHDRMSSFKTTSNTPNYFLITIYRDENYGGRSYSWIIPHAINIADLRVYHMSSAEGS